MTYEEAKVLLEATATNLLGDSCSVKDERISKLMLRKYEAISIAIDVLEKQIPKKVKSMNESNGDYYWLDFICPNCDEAVIGQPYRPNNCKHCGQAIDWSE